MSIFDLFKDDDFRSTYVSIDSKYVVDEISTFSELSFIDISFRISNILDKEDIDFILGLPLVVYYKISFSVSSKTFKVSVRLDYSKK